MTSHRHPERLERMLEKCLRADENSPGNTNSKKQKIQILIDAQTKYEEQFGKIVDRIARRDALFARYNQHLAKTGKRPKDLAEDPFLEILTRVQKELQD
jgi:hypothetical protein